MSDERDEFVPGQLWNSDYKKPRQLCVEYDIANPEHSAVMDAINDVLDRFRWRKSGEPDGLCSTDYPLGDWPLEYVPSNRAADGQGNEA